jgi:riboflavin kinase/FMN adenylyltransferase
MEIIKELAKIKPTKETALTIGVFDGVHLGHQSLLNYLKEKAQNNGWLSGVITFKSHPETVLEPGSHLPLLDNIDNRIDLMAKMSIDIVIALSFTAELKQLTAREFMELLKVYLNLRALTVGHDFALGKDRDGNVDQLSVIGKEMGFSVEVVPPLVVDGEVVSSSLIRDVLDQGNLRKATKLLGRYFGICGLVVAGEQRGRTLGFPTANLEVSSDYATLPDGVYASIAYVNGEAFPSVTNVGFCPTFGGVKRLVETHIIAYEAELLGQLIRVDFVDKLRDEICFDDVGQLKLQIGKDVDQARRIISKVELAKSGSPECGSAKYLTG